MPSAFSTLHCYGRDEVIASSGNELQTLGSGGPDARRFREALMAEGQIRKQEDLLPQKKQGDIDGVISAGCRA